MTTLLIAEDQVMMREALALLLDLEHDLSVVGQVGRGDEALSAVGEHRPDVVLLDIELPGASGIDVAAALRAQAPQTIVVIVTTFGRPGYLRRALDAGVRGFVVKDGPVEILAETIRRVVAGEVVIDPVLAAYAGRRAEPAHRTGARRAAGGHRRRHGRGHRPVPAPVRTDRAQLPVGRDRQDRHAQPGRGRLGGTAPRLALSGAAAAYRSMREGGPPEGEPPFRTSWVR